MTAGQMRWHEGFIIRYQMSTADGCVHRGASERYQIAYSDGMSEWLDGLPEPGIAFRMPGGDARVPREHVQRALRVHALA